MYLLIENFNNGMDSRRMALTSKPGTLQDLVNCHITRGGEIEKRKSFVKLADLPENTFGLHSVNSQLVVFGSDENVTIPAINGVPIVYNRLLAGGTSAQISFGETPETSACSVVQSYRLKVTMKAMGGIGSANFTFTGTSKPPNGKYTAEKIDADNFYINTGTVDCSSDVVVSTVVQTKTYNSTAVDSEPSSRLATINYAPPSNFGSKAYIYFPELPSLSGDFDVLEKTGTSFKISSSTFPDTITKASVNPSVSSIKAGGTEILSGTIAWKYQSGTLSALSVFGKAVSDSINSKTGVHGISAENISGVILLTGKNISNGTAVSVTVNNLQLSTSGSFSDNGVNVTKFYQAENFGGKVYAIAQFDGNKVQHFFDSKRVVSWDKISESGNVRGIASALAGIIKDDVFYSATSFGADIIINFKIPDVPFVVEVFAVNGGVSNTQSITTETITPAGNGLAQVQKVTISGDYEFNDTFTVSIDGKQFSIRSQASMVGTFAKTYNGKMYSIAGSLLYFSETDTNGGPSSFSNDTLAGAGVINLSNQNSSSDALTSIAVYQGKLAIFSKTSVQIWTMNADPKLNSQSQILDNIGTMAPRSVCSLGNIDTYFLSSSGIRSLKARDASNVAIISDIGTAIDDLIFDDIKYATQSQIESAIGLIDPVEGRYWLIIGTKVYVYSYYPTPNISAWATYNLTDKDGNLFEVDFVTILNNRIYFRSGNSLYLYGGLSNEEYDTSSVVVKMPYLDGGKPAHFKTITAIDSACVGTWDVYCGMDVTVPNVRSKIGTITNSTYTFGRVMASGIGTHIGIEMINNTAEKAKIGNFAAHFEINDAG